MDPATELPAEIFQEILSYLEADELAKATRVSRFWNDLASNGVLWQALCRSRWQGKRYMRRIYDIGRLISFLILSNSIGLKIWTSSPSKWKWAYGEAELESQRTATTESEIIESYWKFTVSVIRQGDC